MTKVESYFLRNKVDVVSGWTYEEYCRILKSILVDNITCVNDILKVLHNKTLDSLIDLLENNLKIGNKKLRFRTKCNSCGKDVYRKLYLYKTGNFYCDMECRNKNKRDFPKVGKDSCSYTRKSVICTNCGKQIEVPLHKLNNKNRFGDTHIFCSKKCYWEYRGKYYIKDKTNFCLMSKEKRKEVSSRNALNNLKNNKYPKTLTKIHIKIDNLLESMKIIYQNESVYGHFSFDIELIDSGLLIEIMGDYWHANPNVYKCKEKLNKYQLKDVRIDKSKRAFIKKIQR